MVGFFSAHPSEMGRGGCRDSGGLTLLRYHPSIHTTGSKQKVEPAPSAIIRGFWVTTDLWDAPKTTL